MDGFRGGMKNWWSTLTMGAATAEYQSLHLREHELLRDVPLYDASSMDLPGGGNGADHRGHSYARIRDPSEPHRDFPLRPSLSLGTGIRLGLRTDAAERLIVGTPLATRPMRLGSNARYSGRTLLGLVPIPLRASWLTRPYSVAMEPFRLVLYPTMLRRIRRAWIAAYVGMSRNDG